MVDDFKLLESELGNVDDSPDLSERGHHLLASSLDESFLDDPRISI